MEFKVKCVNIKSAIYVQTKTGAPRPERSISCDQANLTVKDGFLEVVVKGHRTLIPMNNVASLVPLVDAELEE